MYFKKQTTSRRQGNTIGILEEVDSIVSGLSTKCPESISSQITTFQIASIVFKICRKHRSIYGTWEWNAEFETAYGGAFLIMIPT